MQAYNLCYSTLVNPSDVSSLDPSKYKKEREWACFCTSTLKFHVRNALKVLVKSLNFIAGPIWRLVTQSCILCQVWFLLRGKEERIVSIAKNWTISKKIPTAGSNGGSRSRGVQGSNKTKYLAKRIRPTRKTWAFHKSVDKWRIKKSHQVDDLFKTLRPRDIDPFYHTVNLSPVLSCTKGLVSTSLESKTKDKKVEPRKTNEVTSNSISTTGTST